MTSRAHVRTPRWESPALLAGLLLLPGLATGDQGQLRVAPLPPVTTEPVPTRIVVRVVSHGALVLGRKVGGARVTITEVETGRLLASGLQQGESGDRNQIMRTPHLMKEPIYTTLPSAAFRTTLKLAQPTVVEIAAQGPLGHPESMQRASKTVLLIPGQDLEGDGIILDLNGYLVAIEQPSPGESLIAKDDVTLVASIRTLSGDLVRPHGDWDSRQLMIYGEVLIEDTIVERLQLFYTGTKSRFAAPFFVPLQSRAPNGITLRVVAADGARGNFGLREETYPVLPKEAILRKDQ